MASLVQGLVISHLGQGVAVEVSGEIVLCQTRRRLDTVTVGDQVLIEIVGTQQGRIETILPRRSVLLRPSRLAKTRPVAANIDKIYVVFASEPSCDFLLIDQYLAICETSQIEVVLVLNKIDLPLTDDLENELNTYLTLGYQLYRVSANEEWGLVALKSALRHQVSLLTGQSGVGKSSLTNRLIKDKPQKVAALSAVTKHGRHTTTAATLYHLAEGGDLIDSPGVAIFGLAELTERQLAWGYREFQSLLEQCQFHNCRHLKDKGCAVRIAAENGDISMARYQRFLKLRSKMPTEF
jgi:ribosome biogenesis GTPase